MKSDALWELGHMKGRETWILLCHLSGLQRVKARFVHIATPYTPSLPPGSPEIVLKTMKSTVQPSGFLEEAYGEL